MGDPSRRSIPQAVEGSNVGDLRPIDWGQLLVNAGVVGSSFLGIALALRSIDPGTIAFGRAALGASALAVLPNARHRIARIDWPRLFLAAVLGMGAPLLLGSLAEERIPSALVGMLVSAIPIITAALAAAVTRRWPTPRRFTGLLVGFVGIALLTAPNLGSSGTEMVGVVMVLGALTLTAVASLLFAPLQQTYGSLPVTMWLLVISTAMLAPLGLMGLSESNFEWLGVIWLLVLGVVSTGGVWAMWIDLIGRIGAVRAAIASYIIPIVALVLGVVVLDEHLEAIQIAGVAVAIFGGYLLSRGQHRAAGASSDARLSGRPVL